MGSVFSNAIRETYKKNIYNEFKISLQPIFKFKHLQKIIIPSAWLRFFGDGLAQTGDEIVFRDVGEDKYRIELKKASRGFWVDAENTPLLTIKENESDNISTNRGEALDGARLGRKTSAISISSREENESNDISANRGEALDATLPGRNTSVVSISSREENESDDISANRGEALDGTLSNRNTSAVSIFSREIPLWEWIFVVSNLTVELPSAVFEQLSSPHKPLYALMAMALSLLALVICVIELLYKGLRGGVTFKWPRGKVPWFYYPSRSQNHKPFGTFADLVGLVSVISQCIVTAINYDFARRAANSPIKFSLLPIIFALGLLFSRILEAVEKKASERQDR